MEIQIQEGASQKNLLSQIRERPDYQRIRTALNHPLHNLSEAASTAIIAGERFRFGLEKNPLDIEKYDRYQKSWVPWISLENQGIEREIWSIRSIFPSPSTSRALINLAYKRGDHTKTLEIDFMHGEVVDNDRGGFFAPLGSGGLTWITDNSVVAFVALSVEEKTMSGHPRQARLWRRSQLLNQATLISEVQYEDLTITLQHNSEQGIITHHHSQHEKSRYLVNLYTGLTQALELPSRSQVFIADHKIIVVKYEDTGAVVDLVNLEQNDEGFILSKPVTLYSLGEEEVLRQVALWEEHVVLVLIRNGEERLFLLGTRTGMLQEPFPGVHGSIKVISSPESETSILRILWSNLVNPPRVESIYHDGNEFICEPSEPPVDRMTSHTAVSRDGALVRYFLARPEEVHPYKPTLLLVYGGFGIPFIPNYLPEVASGWMEHGGQVVVGQIRGGGEKGYAWHREGMQEGKLLAVEDAAAIAHDLVSRGVCTPGSLVCQGTSNGGLLISLMVEKYRDICAAAAVHNALFDLSAYDSWDEARTWREEYGVFDSSSREKVLSYSPLHNIPSEPMPPLLISTEANDDRVDPSGAKRMVEALVKKQQNVIYRVGNGSHHGAANLEEALDLMALTFSFFTEQIERNQG